MGEQPDTKPKLLLFAAVDQVLTKVLETGNRANSTDITVEYDEGEQGGWTAKVTMPSMKGDLATQVFEGEASPFKRDSMLSACQIALDALLQDPTYGSKIDMEEAET